MVFKLMFVTISMVLVSSAMAANFQKAVLKETAAKSADIDVLDMFGLRSEWDLGNKKGIMTQLACISLLIITNCIEAPAKETFDDMFGLDIGSAEPTVEPVTVVASKTL